MVPQTSQSARPSKTISCHCSRRSGAVRGVSLYTVAGVNTHVDKIKAKSVVAHQIWSDMQLKHKAVFFCCRSMRPSFVQGSRRRVFSRHPSDALDVL